MVPWSSSKTHQNPCINIMALKLLQFRSWADYRRRFTITTPRDIPRDFKSGLTFQFGSVFIIGFNHLLSPWLFATGRLRCGLLGIKQPNSVRNTLRRCLSIVQTHLIGHKRYVTVQSTWTSVFVSCVFLQETAENYRGFPWFCGLSEKSATRRLNCHIPFVTNEVCLYDG